MEGTHLPGGYPSSCRVSLFLAGILLLEGTLLEDTLPDTTLQQCTLLERAVARALRGIPGDGRRLPDRCGWKKLVRCEGAVIRCEGAMAQQLRFCCIFEVMPAKEASSVFQLRTSR